VLGIIESQASFPHYLCVCAIAKNEAPYFAEWLEYHILMGVGKFYIYDNESDDNTKKVLAPYIKAGIVEYTYWPGEKQQLPAYEDCIKRHKYDARWLAFIDIDEFIVPMKDKNLNACLSLIPYDAGQILLPWALYGSGGHLKKTDGLVMERFQKRADGTHSCKPIVNPRRLKTVNICYTPHRFDVSGSKTMDSNGKILVDDNNFSPRLEFDARIRVNHYVHKSRQEYLERKSRGEVFHGKNHLPPAGSYAAQFDQTDRSLNAVLDPVMDKYVAPVKKAILRRKA